MDWRISAIFATIKNTREGSHTSPSLLLVESLAGRANRTSFGIKSFKKSGSLGFESYQQLIYFIVVISYNIANVIKSINN
tara:strand:- start:261 stop:500 length:240 start_codon:yes stop_codon:yes gene_type:complete